MNASLTKPVTGNQKHTWFQAYSAQNTTGCLLESYYECTHVPKKLANRHL